MGSWFLSKVPGFRGGHTVWMLLSRVVQEAISGRCAYGEQLGAALLTEVQMPMPRQPLRPGWGGKGPVVWSRSDWPLSRRGAGRVGLLVTSRADVPADRAVSHLLDG